MNIEANKNMEDSEFKDIIIRIIVLINTMTCVMAAVREQDGEEWQDSYLMDSCISPYHIDGHAALNLFKSVWPKIRKLEVTEHAVVAYAEDKKGFQLQRRLPNIKSMFLNSLPNGIYE